MRTLVFDVDDVLWGLNDFVFEHLGINPVIITDFCLDACSELSDGLRRKMLKMYQSVDVFYSLTPYAGVERIPSLERLGYNLKINSNCSSLEVMNYKLKVLRSLGFKKENIVLDVGYKTKEIGEDVFGFIDDSPYNVVQSNAKINFMPRKVWNTSEKMKSLVRSKNTVYYSDLNELIDYLEVI